MQWLYNQYLKRTYIKHDIFCKYSRVLCVLSTLNTGFITDVFLSVFRQANQKIVTTHKLL